jgi:predicted HicB family RNase H-like nuclease
MNTLNYKGFFGTVSFSLEDNVIYGKIIGINDLVTYEAQNVEELKAAFQEAVEDYLDLCKRVGKEPLKSYKGSFNVRVKPEIHLQAAIQSAKLGMSLNQFVEQAIDRELKEKNLAGSY